MCGKTCTFCNGKRYQRFLLHEAPKVAITGGALAVVLVALSNFSKLVAHARLSLTVTRQSCETPDLSSFIPSISVFVSTNLLERQQTQSHEHPANLSSMLPKCFDILLVVPILFPVALGSFERKESMANCGTFTREEIEAVNESGNLDEVCTAGNQGKERFSLDTKCSNKCGAGMCVGPYGSDMYCVCPWYCL